MKRSLTSRLPVLVIALGSLAAFAACNSSSDPAPGAPASKPATPNGQGGNGPNLQVDQAALDSSVAIDTQDFDLNSCEVVDACVSGTGTRKLLHFDADIINAGNQDLILGNPANNPNFQYDPCHQHYHLQNMMQYALLDATTGNVVAVNSAPVVVRKQGFCLMDSEQYSPTANPDPTYDCTNQGLSVGWEDVYDVSVDCQWLDITGVPPGNYILQLTVNPDHVYPDTNFNDNTAQTPVTIN